MHRPTGGDERRKQGAALLPDKRGGDNRHTVSRDTKLAEGDERDRGAGTFFEAGPASTCSFAYRRLSVSQEPIEDLDVDVLHVAREASQARAQRRVVVAMRSQRRRHCCASASGQEAFRDAGRTEAVCDGSAEQMRGDMALASRPKLHQDVVLRSERERSREMSVCRVGAHYESRNDLGMGSLPPRAKVGAVLERVAGLRDREIIEANPVRRDRELGEEPRVVGSQAKRLHPDPRCGDL
jgi:hypothetical protein